MLEIYYIVNQVNVDFIFANTNINIIFVMKKGKFQLPFLDGEFSTPPLMRWILYEHCI
jgi:hypothetical protein